MYVKSADNNGGMTMNIFISILVFVGAFALGSFGWYQIFASSRMAIPAAKRALLNRYLDNDLLLLMYKRTILLWSIAIIIVSIIVLVFVPIHFLIPFFSGLGISALFCIKAGSTPSAIAEFVKRLYFYMNDSGRYMIENNIEDFGKILRLPLEMFDK